LDLGPLRYWAAWSIPRDNQARLNAESLIDIGDPLEFAEARKLIAIFNAIGQEQKLVLQGLLSRSARHFDPLPDPLTIDLGLHRWLKSQREESYSDWLQWVLQQLDNPASVAKLFGLPLPSLEGPVSIEREVQVRGIGGDCGRLDLLVRLAGQVLCVVEVKTRGYADEDLLKHDLYLACAEVPRGTPALFLAPEANEVNLRGFTFVSWADLTQRLRAQLPAVVDRKGLCVGAMCLAFVSSVERNLCGFAGLESDDAT
jgi:hypothetical protein